jgi:CubicO group peptidase (beta-lactamase class C family)
MAAVSPSTGVISWSAGRLPGGRPARTRTPRYAGSITKQFMAALVADAVLARRLDYHASVGWILLALPPWAELVRVRHLVHHTAGLPSTARLLAALVMTDEAALDDHLVLQGLSRLPELHEAPGRVFDYSNIGYVLLAEILRRALGTDPDAGTALALLTGHHDAHLVSDVAMAIHERLLVG